MIFVDLKHMELSENTQRTSVGKNASSGTISLVSTSPRHQQSADLRAVFEDSERLRLASQIVDPGLSAQFDEGILEEQEAEFTVRMKRGDAEHEMWGRLGACGR